MSSSDVEIVADDIDLAVPARLSRDVRAENSSRHADGGAVNAALHYNGSSSSPARLNMGRVLGPSGTEVLELSDGSESDDEIQVTAFKPSEPVGRKEWVKTFIHNCDNELISPTRRAVDDSSEDEALPGPFGCFRRGSTSESTLAGPSVSPAGPHHAETAP